MKVKIKLVTGEPLARRRQVQSNYYRQARYFEIAADILSDSVNAKSINVPQGFHTNIPVVVNHALALELYLKCLLQIEDKEACGHDLDELFAKLNPGHRSRIEQVYDAWIASPRAGMKVADILKRSADAFTKWRYLNEARHQKSPGIYDATLLLPHVRKIIWEDVPQLKAILPLFPNQR